MRYRRILPKSILDLYDNIINKEISFVCFNKEHGYYGGHETFRIGNMCEFDRTTCHLKFSVKGQTKFTVFCDGSNIPHHLHVVYLSDV